MGLGHKLLISGRKWILLKLLNEKGMFADEAFTLTRTNAYEYTNTTVFLFWQSIFSVAYLSPPLVRPCLNESRGTLFLALCHLPWSPCLLLLYFWGTHCMMGSQWPLPPHSEHIAPRFLFFFLFWNHKFTSKLNQKLPFNQGRVGACSSIYINKKSTALVEVIKRTTLSWKTQYSVV